MHTNWFASVVLAVSVTCLGVGCGGETDGSVEPRDGRTLTTTYDKLTVVGEVDDQGFMRVTPRNAEGEALLVLRVVGDHLEIEPRADVSLAPWSGTVPANVVAENDLSDWSLLAYAYASGLRPEGEHGADLGGLKPQMMSAGTDGQMCIAAGGTWAECTYYLYCRRSWCPFW